ncbi:MAG: hypothetical protein AB7S70_08555 [Hyphomicrobium sp.]
MIAFRAAMTRKGELESRKEHVRNEPVRFVPITTEQPAKKR